MRIRIILLVGILFFGMYGNAMAGLNDSLVAYYPFDNNSNDMSGNANHGTVYGALMTTDRFGNSNSAYSFDGIDDYIHVSQGLFASLPNSYSISAWFYPESLDGENYFVWEASGGIYYKLAIENGKFVVGQSPQTYGYQTVNSCFDVESMWNHAVLVWDGNHIKGYLNGRFIGEAPINDSNSWDIGFSIGGPPNGPSKFFNGLVDEVRIYDRALSELEIQSLYTGENLTEGSNNATIGLGLDINIPSAEYTSLGGTSNIWVDLEYKGIDSNGDFVWRLKDYGLTD